MLVVCCMSKTHSPTHHHTHLLYHRRVCAGACCVLYEQGSLTNSPPHSPTEPQTCVCRCLLCAIWARLTHQLTTTLTYWTTDVCVQMLAVCYMNKTHSPPHSPTEPQTCVQMLAVCYMNKTHSPPHSPTEPQTCVCRCLLCATWTRLTHHHTHLLKHRRVCADARGVLHEQDSLTTTLTYWTTDVCVQMHAVCYMNKTHSPPHSPTEPQTCVCRCLLCATWTRLTHHHTHLLNHRRVCADARGVLHEQDSLTTTLTYWTTDVCVQMHAVCYMNKTHSPPHSPTEPQTCVCRCLLCATWTRLTHHHTHLLKHRRVCADARGVLHEQDSLTTTFTYWTTDVSVQMHAVCYMNKTHSPPHSPTEPQTCVCRCLLCATWTRLTHHHTHLLKHRRVCADARGVLHEQDSLTTTLTYWTTDVCVQMHAVCYMNKTHSPPHSPTEPQTCVCRCTRCATWTRLTHHHTHLLNHRRVCADARGVLQEQVR